MRRRMSGLTLIELLVVMAVLAILATLAVPRYLDRVADAREVVLKQNLHGLRIAIDQYYRDKAQYPPSLQMLANERYLREVPIDPITQRADTWVVVPPTTGNKQQVFDVKSGADGLSKDGSKYAGW